MEKKKYKAETQGHYTITVMKPEVVNVSNVPALENVARDVLCRNGNPVKYRDCDDYNTEFCRTECSFGIKETPIADVSLDYQDKSGR